MNDIEFEWDDDKNKINSKKHGISFEDAKSVFFDDDAILFEDPDHSIGEERFLIIGFSKIKKICIVSHCYREKNSIIRIISAREATKSEKKIYTKGLGDWCERRIRYKKSESEKKSIFKSVKETDHYKYKLQYNWLFSGTVTGIGDPISNTD